MHLRIFLYILRAAFKLGRRVHFGLRRKMRKPPITRVPAILNGLTNRPSWKTDSIYADIVRHGHEWLHFRSIQSSNEENGRSGQFLLVSECISVFRVIRCLKVGTYLSNKGITYLLKGKIRRLSSNQSNFSLEHNASNGSYFLWNSLFCIFRLCTILFTFPEKPQPSNHLSMI